MEMNEYNDMSNVNTTNIKNEIYTETPMRLGDLVKFKKEHDYEKLVEYCEKTEIDFAQFLKKNLFEQEYAKDFKVNVNVVFPNGLSKEYELMYQRLKNGIAMFDDDSLKNIIGENKHISFNQTLVFVLKPIYIIKEDMNKRMSEFERDASEESVSGTEKETKSRDSYIKYKILYEKLGFDRIILKVKKLWRIILNMANIDEKKDNLTPEMVNYLRDMFLNINTVKYSRKNEESKIYANDETFVTNFLFKYKYKMFKTIATIGIKEISDAYIPIVNEYRRYYRGEKYKKLRNSMRSFFGAPTGWVKDGSKVSGGFPIYLSTRPDFSYYYENRCTGDKRVDIDELYGFSKTYYTINDYLSIKHNPLATFINHVKTMSKILEMIIDMCQLYIINQKNKPISDKIILAVMKQAKKRMNDIEKSTEVGLVREIHKNFVSKIKKSKLDTSFNSVSFDELINDIRKKIDNNIPFLHSLYDFSTNHYLQKYVSDIDHEQKNIDEKTKKFIIELKEKYIKPNTTFVVITNDYNKNYVDEKYIDKKYVNEKDNKFLSIDRGRIDFDNMDSDFIEILFEYDKTLPKKDSEVYFKDAYEKVIKRGNEFDYNGKISAMNLCANLEYDIVTKIMESLTDVQTINEDNFPVYPSNTLKKLYMIIPENIVTLTGLDIYISKQKENKNSGYTSGFDFWIGKCITVLKKNEYMNTTLSNISAIQFIDNFLSENNKSDDKSKLKIKLKICKWASRISVENFHKYYTKLYNKIKFTYKKMKYNKFLMDQKILESNELDQFKLYTKSNVFSLIFNEPEINYAVRSLANSEYALWNYENNYITQILDMMDKKRSFINFLKKLFALCYIRNSTIEYKNGEFIKQSYRLLKYFDVRDKELDRMDFRYSRNFNQYYMSLLREMFEFKNYGLFRASAEDRAYPSYVHTKYLDKGKMLDERISENLIFLELKCEDIKNAMNDLEKTIGSSEETYPSSNGTEEILNIEDLYYDILFSIEGYNPQSDEKNKTINKYKKEVVDIITILRLNESKVDTSLKYNVDYNNFFSVASNRDVFLKLVSNFGSTLYKNKGTEESIERKRRDEEKRKREENIPLNQRQLERQEELLENMNRFIQESKENKILRKKRKRQEDEKNARKFVARWFEDNKNSNAKNTYQKNKFKILKKLMIKIKKLLNKGYTKKQVTKKILKKLFK